MLIQLTRYHASPDHAVLRPNYGSPWMIVGEPSAYSGGDGLDSSAPLARQGRRCAARFARPCRAALDRRALLRSMAGKGCAGRATLYRSRAFPRWAALCRRRLPTQRLAGAESPARRPQRFDLRGHVARSRCGAAPRSVAASPAPTCVQVPSDPFTVQRPCSVAKSVGRVTYDHPRSPGSFLRPSRSGSMTRAFAAARTT